MPKFTHIASIVGLALLATTALSGCSVIDSVLGNPGSAVRDEEGQVVEEGDVDVFTIAVGDCFDDEGEGEISSVPIVPCDQPHDNELYYEFTLADGDYPGDDEVGTQANDGCLGAFPDFVGLAYEESTLDYFPITPTSASWSGGDRVVQCAIYDPAGPITGTLAGKAL